MAEASTAQMRAFTPSVSSSRTCGMSPTSIGTPQAMTSSTVLGKPSTLATDTTTSLAWYQVGSVVLAHLAEHPDP